MTNTMRAIVAEAPGGPDSLVLRQLPVPEPGVGQVRIRVAYSALNPLDTHARADRIKWGHPGFPFVPGYEYAGRVDAVGSGVDPALVGRRVAVMSEWGGNADFALATAARVVPVPDEFDWRLGAVFATCAATSWHLVHSAARIAPGMTMLVHSAAGAVGALTTQIAVEAGARVIGLAGGAAKVAYARQFGASDVLDYSSGDWVPLVKELTGGRGVDVVIDGNAGPDAPRNYDAVAPLGNVIYLGAMAGQAPPVNISQLIGKSFSVTGFVQFFHQSRSRGVEEAGIRAALSSGRWRIPVERVFPLEDVPLAQALFESRQLMGRSLIEVGGDI
jgi:NADPH2:quinone reductase